MHADVDTALASSRATPHRAQRDTALYCGFGGLVVLLGILSLLPDSRLTGVVQSKTPLHALFGLLLWGLVAVRFCWWLKNCPPAHAVEILQFSRRLSRMVYLVLYLVTGAMQVINIIGALPYDTRSARDLALLKPGPDCQAFLICGLVALVSIRVIAFLSWRRLVRSIAG
jgi:hypothetical protein